MKTSFLLLLLFNTTCMQEQKLPDCIKEKIVEIEGQEVWNPPAEVWKWTVDEETYYYFTSAGYDQFNYLYNSDCELVCAPDGGFSGRGDGKCPDFLDDAEKKLVWKDNRQ